MGMVLSQDAFWDGRTIKACNFLNVSVFCSLNKIVTINSATNKVQVR